MTIVVALLGRSRNGKSTAARYLRDQYGFQVIGFTHPLREMAKTIWGFTDEQVYGDADSKDVVDIASGVSPRHALRILGEAVKKSLGMDILIKMCLRRIRESSHTLWAIEDTRTAREALAIMNCREFNGNVVKLSYMDAESPQDHTTELAVDLVPDECITRVITHSTSDDASDLLTQVDDFVQGVIDMNDWHDPNDEEQDDDIEDADDFEDEDVMDVFDYSGEIDDMTDFFDYDD